MSSALKVGVSVRARFSQVSSFLTLGAIIFGTSGVAHAYRTAGDLPEFEGTRRVRWEGGFANFLLVDDLPGGVGNVSVNADLIEQALRAWSETECSLLQVGFAGLTSTPAAYGDGQNTIQWVRSGWGDLGFEAQAAGATDIRYEDVDGEWQIVEADVYLNAEDHEWTTGVGTDDAREIVGVLTHELGHALGILHPCLEGAEPECTEQENENPSTMHPAYSHGQLSLEPDDIAGICFLYPACSADSCEDGFECTKRGCLEECGGTLCESYESCVEGACIDYSDPCQVGSPACESCERDENCGFGYRCEEGECIGDTVPIGDPCATFDDCETAACSDAGYCTVLCFSDDDCGVDGTCDLDEHVCSTDPGQPFGGGCDSADDCLSEKCLSDLTDEPICTRTCTADAGCPFGFECGEASDEVVCVPPPLPPPEDERLDIQRVGCSCRAAGNSRDSVGSSWPLAISPLFLFFLRRRRGFRLTSGTECMGNER